MYRYKANGRTLAQYTVRVDLKLHKVLRRIARQARIKTVNKLIESIICEIVVDEIEESERNKSQDLTLAQH